MEKPFLLAIVAVLLAGLVLLGLSDTSISIADTGVPDNEAASSVSKASSSSTRATIVITMYALPSE